MQGMPCKNDKVCLDYRAMNPAMASEIIDAFGGTTAVARLCRCTTASVSEWRHSGIPLARWLYLHAIRPDVVPPPPAPAHLAADKGTRNAA